MKSFTFLPYVFLAVTYQRLHLKSLDDLKFQHIDIQLQSHDDFFS